MCGSARGRKEGRGGKGALECKRTPLPPTLRVTFLVLSFFASFTLVFCSFSHCAWRIIGLHSLMRALMNQFETCFGVYPDCLASSSLSAGVGYGDSKWSKSHRLNTSGSFSGTALFVFLFSSCSIRRHFSRVDLMRSSLLPTQAF